MIDELLSGYLDDTLSGDERRRVEQMLRDQPQLSSDLDDLKELRRTLQVIAGETSVGPSLPAGFADRVIDAAIAQAKDEGLDADHHVLRANTSDTIVTPAGASRMFYRVAGGLAALAASIALVVYTTSDDKSDTNALLDPNSLVSNEDGPNVDPTAPFVPPEIVPSIEPGDIASPDVGPMLAGSDSDNAGAVPGKVDAEKPIESPMIASSDNVKTPPDVVPVAPQDYPGTLGFTNFVPIFEVRLTQAGHDSEAFRKALKDAGITLGDSRKLSPEIVAFAKSATSDGDMVAPEVILLECSIKKLSVLHNRLFADGSGVQSVRFGLTMDAPIRSMIDAVRLDPENVRQKSTGFPLVAPTERMTDALGRELGKVKMGQTDREGLDANLTLIAPVKDGEDTTMPMLILVR